MADAELEEALRVYLDASPTGGIYPYFGEDDRTAAIADHSLTRGDRSV